MTSKVGYLIKNMSLFQKLGWAYAAMFFVTVALGYIPGFTDDQGQLFGLFSIQFHDDLLHLASGIWAAWAAWHSTRAIKFYFRTFGIMYSLDGLLGLLTGYGYLDGGIFFHMAGSHDLVTRVAANLPHILIGGTAVLIGFVLSRRS